MSNEPVKTNQESTKEQHAWTEQIEVAGSELVEEGNVRRLIIRTKTTSCCWKCR